MLRSRAETLLAASHSSTVASASRSRSSSGYRQLALTAFGVVLPLLGACRPPGDGGGHHDEPTGSDGIGAPGQAFVLAYEVPDGHTPRDFVLIGQQSVSLGDGAQARTADDSFAMLANVGEEPLELQKAAESGSAISVGDIVLGKDARVHGDVTTAGSVRGSRGIIDGTRNEDAQISLRRIERTVTFPGAMAPAQRVPSSGSTPEETLSPGYYESLFVSGEGRVSLPSGEYYFDQLEVGSHATLVVEDGAGPVTIYVRERLDVDGAWEHESDDVAQVTLVYLGEGNVVLTQPFEGTLIAPRANLELLAAPEAQALTPPSRLRSGDRGHQGAWHRNDRDRHDGHDHDDGHHDHDHGRHRGHGHRHHHHHGHGHGHDQDPPADGAADYIGTFVGLELSVGTGVTVVHHPISPERGPAAGGRFFTFEFPLPSGVSPEEVDLGSIAGVDIGDGVSLEPGCNPGAARVTTSASGPTSVGTGSQLASIVSVGSVSLAGGASLSGAVSSAGSISASGANITGSQQANASLDDFRMLRWNVTFPGGALPDLQLETGRARVLYPEVYGKVSLAAGSTLYLRSGTYHFGSLLAAAGSSIVLESSGGPVVVNVADEVRLEGSVSGLGGIAPQLFVGYAGSRSAFVGGNFAGTLVAPRARVSLLGGSHQGQILARTVTVSDAVTFRQCSADWDFVLSAPLVNPVPMALPSSPVVLSAVDGTGGSATPSGLVPFEIPQAIPVSRGNAGNGTAVLSFTDADGDRVSCTYRGGASQEHPETLLDLARGREYLFQSCSNGAGAGSTATGTDFDLSLDGDPQGPGGTVTAEVPLGRGCDGRLGAPISPARSVEMLQAFDWAATTALPETNADGTPTLFYANIYIRNETERELLDRFLIHYSGKPLFDDELESLYKGRCGALDLSGDGNGLFVFAMLPGKTYNRIRAAVTNPDIRPEERVMFQAIVLRDPPAGLRNADRSLDYAGLKEAGFYYLGVRELPVDAALDHTALPGGAAKTFIDAIEFVATVARDAGRAVVDVLGEIDRALQGEITVRLDIDVHSLVPEFSGRAMLRGWGPDAGSEAGLRGVRVEIMQWAQSRYAAGLPIATSYFARTNRDGRVSIRVAKGGGGDARGLAGLCIDMENGAGQLTHFLLANTVCDFRGLDVTRIAEDGTTPVPTSFGNFQQDTNVVLTTTHSEFQILSEVTNASDYVRDVVGTRVRQPRILTGSNAAVLSAGKDQPWVGCFGFPNLVTDSVFFATIGIPVAGFYLGVLATTDMVVQPAVQVETTYGVMVHEYGHYALCGIIAQYDENPVITFTALLTDISVEGLGGPDADPEPEDTSRVIHEAFADFIAGQVVGGSDYFPLGNSAVGVGGLASYCNGSGSNCWDQNLSSRADGNDSIGRLATLLHDAFDGHPKNALAPTNGDIWQASGGSLILSSAGYGDAADEPVVLGGPRLNEVVDVFLVENLLQSARDEGVPDVSFRIGALETAVGSVVLQDHSWCQACEMFLPHWASTARLSHFKIWEGCRDDAGIVNAIGSPPVSDVRLDVNDCSPCLPDQISGPNGCEFCPPGEYASGETCVPCTPGSVPDGSASGCSPCAANQVSSGSSCVDCPLGQGPDRALNLCVDCAIDATLDWSTQSDPACSAVELTQWSAPGDACPDQFWVEAVNLNGTSSDGRSSDFEIHVDLADDIEDAPLCLSTDLQAALAELQGSSLVSLSSAASTEPGFCVPGGDPINFCLDGSCVHLVELRLTSAEVGAGRTSVRIMGNGVGLNGNVPVQVTVATTDCEGEGPPR